MQAVYTHYECNLYILTGFKGFGILTSWVWCCSTDTCWRVCKDCTIVYVVCNWWFNKQQFKL